jgi:hypothetical protein
MAHHAQAPVRYETELLAVEFGESVTLECADGLRVAADAAVLAGMVAVGGTGAGSAGQGLRLVLGTRR